MLPAWPVIPIASPGGAFARTVCWIASTASPSTALSLDEVVTPIVISAALPSAE
jgi:hypothetical protein